MKYKTLIKIAERNQHLRDKLIYLERHNNNLDILLNQITNAKAFKLWQAYNNLKKNPKKILKVFSYLKKNSLKNLPEKFKNLNATKNHLDKINTNYISWFNQKYPNKQTVISQSETIFSYQPLISIITPVYNPDKEWLIKCIESVISQTYSNWELCLADDCSTKKHVKEVLKYYAKKDKRIKVLFRKENGHISLASNSAINIASGEFVGLLDHDDELWPNTLWEVVKHLNINPDIDFFYSDEDKIEMDGTHCDPFFKPDWSPELILSTNYITHFAIIRKKIVDEVGGFRSGYEGSQDYDLFLRVIDKTKNIYHIPTVLYSWRKIPDSTATVYTVKNYAHLAAKNALSDFLSRNRIDATVEEGLKLGTFKISYHTKTYPLVSIIIPTKDKIDFLKKCIESITKKTKYPNYEILIIDTGSQEDSSKKYINKVSSNPKIKVLLRHKSPFNFSNVNNFASTKCNGKYLLFLNNDTEVISPDWLSEMVNLGSLSHVGPVGAKLLYPNGKIQHAGIEMLSNGWPHHFCINYPESESYAFPYLNYKDVTKNPTAVTGACLLISREKFRLLGGFDEDFSLEFQDIALSIKARQAGLYPAYTPYATLIHHESQTIKETHDWNRIISKFIELKSTFRDFKTPFNPNIEKIDDETSNVVSQINSATKQVSNEIIHSTHNQRSAKKILFITHLYWPSIGGGEKLFQTLAEKLSQKYQVTVLTSNVTSTDDYFNIHKNKINKPASEEILNNVKILRANVSPTNTMYQIWHKLGSKFRSLWFNYSALFFGPFFDSSLIDKLSKEHWDWIFCGPTPTSALYYGQLLKNKTNSKLAVIPCMHTDDKLHTAKYNISLIKQADLILTLTENENEFLTSKGVDRNKLLTIGIGVDDFLLTTKYQEFDEKDYVLYIGQEGGHKNILILIEAMLRIWKRGYSNKLIIAGARTNYSTIIDKTISDLRPEYKSKIIRINNFTDIQKVALLDNCLVMVNPSSYESFGIVFIEAWARHKAIIGANIPAVNKLISNKRDGLLFKDRNTTQLTNQLLSLINHQKHTITLGRVGYQNVINKYNWPSIIKLVIQKLG